MEQNDHPTPSQMPEAVGLWEHAKRILHRREISGVLSWWQSLGTTKLTRPFWLIISTALAWTGFGIMGDVIPLLRHPAILEGIDNLNRALHLDLNNPINLLIGLLLALVGTGLFVRSFPPLAAPQATPDVPSPDRPTLPSRYLGIRLAGVVAALSLFLLELAFHAFSYAGLFLWLTSILSVSLLLWKREATFIRLRPTAGLADGAWMLALFALAIGWGAYALEDIPPSIIPDEGAFWETASAIAQGKYRPVPFDSGVYSFPVASSMVQGWIMRWTRINLWGWRFASVLAASLSIFPLYLLTRDLFSRRIAILACILMIANPYYLSFARLGYNNSQSLFPVALALYLFSTGIRQGSHLFLWLAGLAAGIGTYTYFSAWLGLPVMLTILLLLPWQARISWRLSLTWAGLILAGWLMLVLPRLVYGFSGESPSSLYYKLVESSFLSGFYGRAIFGEEAIQQAFTWKVGNVEGFFHLRYYVIFLLRGILRSIFIFFNPALYRDHFLLSGLLNPGSGLFFLFGLGLACRGKGHGYLIVNLWFWLGWFLLGVLSSFPPRPTHMLSILPAISILNALGLTSVVQATLRSLPLTHRRWPVEQAALGLILSLLLYLGWYTYFVRMPEEYPLTLEEMASWIARKLSLPSVIFFVESHPVAHSVTYQSNAGLIPHRVLSLLPAEIATLPQQIQGQSFLIFLPSGDAQLASELMRLLPEAQPTPLVLAGRPVAHLISNLSLPEWPLTPGEGWRDLWASPARPILVFSLSLALIMALLERMSSRLFLFPQAPAYRYEGDIRGPWIDIEFRIHIHFPPGKTRHASPPPESGSNNSPSDASLL